ncbi:MAG: 4Fe-4S dicluster domain-containing protein [Proteobacteria bacterium]|nr:4Fe-4S dicluster domain-containing protein [Pseudomonadota bacterium]
MKRIKIIQENCTGCRLCETTCSFAHFRKISPELSRIRIAKEEEFGDHRVALCTQCQEAPCIEVCPVEALTRDQASGIVILDEDECTGCEECREECPTGAPFITKEKDYPLKCDLCGGGEPECVEICSRQALVFEEAPSYLSTHAIGDEKR